MKNNTVIGTIHTNEFLVGKDKLFQAAEVYREQIKKANVVYFETDVEVHLPHLTLDGALLQIARSEGKKVKFLDKIKNLQDIFQSVEILSYSISDAHKMLGTTLTNNMLIGQLDNFIKGNFKEIAYRCKKDSFMNTLMPLEVKAYRKIQELVINRDKKWKIKEKSGVCVIVGVLHYDNVRKKLK